MIAKLTLLCLFASLAIAKPQFGLDGLNGPDNSHYWEEEARRMGSSSTEGYPNQNLGSFSQAELKAMADAIIKSSNSWFEQEFQAVKDAVARGNTESTPSPVNINNPNDGYIVTDK